MYQVRKIAVVGAGAMGAIYAGLFAEAGHQVWAIDTWAAHVEAIQRGQLRLSGASGDRYIEGVRAASDVAAAGACDLYIIATKASGVGPAARAIAAVMPPDALVLTIQNGLGSGERIAAHMPTERVVLGVADGFGAAVKAPGHVHHDAMKLIRLGEMNGGLSERLNGLAELWCTAGFNARAFADIHALIWEKFLCNVSLSAPCTVLDCTIGELLAHPEWREISLGCLREAHTLGLRIGINFSFDDPVAYLQDFVAMMPAASPSMRQDHKAGRKSEIDAINGMVPVLGARYGIPTPYNQTLSAIVRARETAL